MRSGEEQLKYLDQGNEDLHARSLANSAQLQELWGKERELQERLDKLNDEILKYKYDFLQAKEGWEQVRADRDETDRDELKYVRAKQTVLSEDIKETSELLAEVQKQMNCMEAEFGDEPVEKLRQELQEKRQRAEQLEVLLAKLKSAMEVEEKSADELIFMFEKVYERRIRTYAAECAEELAFEEKMERERDQEANAALEEYLRMNQLSIEAEEEASREEFNLLTEKEELSRLESTLHALKIELSTRSNSIAT
ncbi:hypothetical protein BCR41DRAFT_386913 [Lobosporangium transversale]|uniref:Uncharacterized protein n=1 Tax=Lobosporangium transversale TaxID=64571 RepID=A0A1Y2GL63_9FUNG|nr:hypothetical protein BCR41DRAFT_386913 [Lobosporangium transversale]ORZ14351.1 hypothetical protein BCR41DRAFT_386913 [Lobosporangium transversale]|eukprot:XP_021880829.1 hypothetical protein BCR41DRAFT_386913 [Lobosporangium transversale]